jgi:peptidoglycan/LPS O-acetylase OafA/YrhL
MTESNTTTNYRIPSLDGLRTISILLVIISHFVYTIGYTDSLNLGHLGVRFFFVISGFLITGLLLKELAKNENINLTKFYFRRTLRIFPPYYFYLFVILFLSIIGWLEIPLLSFLPAFAYVSNYIHPNTWNLGHAWSLSVEEQFYLIYPGILVLLGKRKTILLLGFLIAVSPIIRVIDYKIFGDEVWLLKGFHSNADGLAIGCLLAFFHEFLHQNNLYLRVLNSKLMILAPILIFVFNAQGDHPLIYLGLSFTVCNLLVALCLDWSITNFKNNAIGKTLNSKPLVMLGVMSYSIYLWQQPFLNHESPSWFTKFPYNILGIILCSSFSYFVVEKVSLKWRHNIEAKLFSKKI